MDNSQQAVNLSLPRNRAGNNSAPSRPASAAAVFFRTDAETTAFTTVRGTFPASTKDQQSGQSDAKKATGVKDADAADLYEHILTIQNAADLEFPAINPANAAERDEFRLNTFPPDNHAPPAPPSPPQPTPPTK